MGSKVCREFTTIIRPDPCSRVSSPAHPSARMPWETALLLASSLGVINFLASIHEMMKHPACVGLVVGGTYNIFRSNLYASTKFDRNKNQWEKFRCNRKSAAKEGWTRFIRCFGCSFFSTFVIVQSMGARWLAMTNPSSLWDLGLQGLNGPECG